MRVIFMGTPDFSVPTFEALLEAGHQIILAVTQPDRAKGRGNSVAFSPVKEAALKCGIEVYQPDRIRDPECVEYLKKQGADIVVVVAYGQILPKEILEMTPYGCVNMHASLLPKYRGASPIQWAVINGEHVTGVTAMRMDEGLDTGDIILSEEVVLDANETGGSLFDRLSEVGARLCVRTLAAIEDGTAVYTPQDNEQATKTGMIRKELGRLDFSRPAEELERLIRGLDPWPGTYTKWNGKTLKILKAGVKEDPGAGRQQGDSTAARKQGNSGAARKRKNPVPAPGTVVDVTRDAVAVQTGDGLLVLLEVQPEGKKKMSCEAFLRGNPMRVGDTLG